MTPPCSESSNPCTVECPYGYQIKVALKTTAAASVSNEYTGCERVCLRKPVYRRLAGFLYGATESMNSCGDGSCACNAWQCARLLLWDYDTHALAMPAEANLLLLDRILSPLMDTTTVEIAFTLDSLKFSGFGTAAKRNGVWTVRNLSGFCAGLVPQSCLTCATDPCTGAFTDECEESDVRVWAICASENAAPALCAKYAVAYGKWTIDWSPTVYYRVHDGLTLRPGLGWGWGEDGSDPSILFDGSALSD